MFSAFNGVFQCLVSLHFSATATNAFSIGCSSTVHNICWWRAVDDVFVRVDGRQSVNDFVTTLGVFWSADDAISRTDASQLPVSP